MVFITFSQDRHKTYFDVKVRRLFNLVKTDATPDLWIKVFIYNSNRYNPGSGLSWEKDEQKIKFFFGDRFGFGDISKYSPWCSYRGHYRYAELGGHGFYDKEWEYLKEHPKVKHVITLKINEDETDLDIAHLIAHEYRHYLQFKKYGSAMTRRGNNGRRTRPVQVERDANKWEKKRIDKLVSEEKL